MLLKSNLHDERTQEQQLRFGMQIANWWLSSTKERLLLLLYQLVVKLVMCFPSCVVGFMVIDLRWQRVLFGGN